MTVFLFASVATSSIRILDYLDWTRRDRVIVAALLALAVGVPIVPTWFDHVLPVYENEELAGLMKAVDTCVSTSYIIAGIMSIFLNLVLSYDSTDVEDELAKRKRLSGTQRIFMNDDEESTNSTSKKKSFLTKMNSHLILCKNNSSSFALRMLSTVKFLTTNLYIPIYSIFFIHIHNSYYNPLF